MPRPKMISGYRVTCQRKDCFGCVNGGCQVLKENTLQGEKCTFYKKKSERPVLAYMYQKESET